MLKQMCEHFFIKRIYKKCKYSCFCKRTNDRNIFKNVFYMNFLRTKIRSNQNYQIKIIRTKRIAQFLKNLFQRDG